MTETRPPLAEARRAAEILCAILEPACERIEIAGSIRRRRPDVKDMELVAVPRMDEVPGLDLWGGTDTVDRLDERLRQLATEIPLRNVEVHRADGSMEYQHRAGSAYKALQFMGIPVDLFIVRPPAEWGVIFALRTGPGDWNTRLVTDCQQWFLRVSGGQVLHHGKPIPCPEEAAFFAALGQQWLEPWDRRVERVRLQRPSL